MHEQSIVESLLAVALDHAKKANATRVLKIHVVVGELSGAVDEAMSFYFGFLSKNTIASGAVLSFEHVPARFRCRSCNTTFSSKGDFLCPQCKDRQVEIVGGRELYVDSLEVD